MGMEKRLRVGVIRDDRYLDHKTGIIHPEHPKRLVAVYRMLDEYFMDSLKYIQPTPAPLDILELVHTPLYIEKVLKTADHDFTSLAPDTPASSRTYLAAWLAAGGCIEGLESLMKGECDVCFCLSRPPGHHALQDRAGGFCIFNNLGITARYAKKVKGFSRILVIDWDVHHGNGIQQLFYKEKEVFYVSTHDINLYPGTGTRRETGEGNGAGYNLNIPIPNDFNDQEFVFLFREILPPIFRHYHPDLVLVAAGFDAHINDPIGFCRLSEEAFGQLTRLLLDLIESIDPGPPLLLSLEGGYQPRSLAACIREVLRVLTGELSEKLSFDTKGYPRLNRLVNVIKQIHAEFGVWTD